MRRTHKDQDELSFVISGGDVEISFEEGHFDEDEMESLSNYAHELAKKAIIDRSVVESKKNKRKHTYLREEGWNFLCDVLVETGYGKYMAPENQAYIAQSIEAMICCYVMSGLQLMTEKTEHISISIDKDSIVDILVCKDSSNEWKSYRGSWKDIDASKETRQLKHRKADKGTDNGPDA